MSVEIERGDFKEIIERRDAKEILEKCTKKDAESLSAFIRIYFRGNENPAIEHLCDFLEGGRFGQITLERDKHILLNMESFRQCLFEYKTPLYKKKYELKCKLETELENKIRELENKIQELQAKII